MRAEVPEGAFSDLFAVKSAKGLRHFYSHPTGCKMCFDPKEANEVVPVRVTLSPTGDFFGWWSAEEKRFSMIYPHRMAVEVCFAYGSAVEEERGRGRVCQLAVVELP